MNELSREDQILLITEMIADIWGRYPELSLTKLLEVSVPGAERSLFHVTDIDLIDWLDDYDKRQQRQQEKTDELADHTRE